MSEYYRKKLICNFEIIDCKIFKNNFTDKGISLYDVIRLINGIPLFIENHLERLHNTEKAGNLKILLSDIEITKKIIELTKINNVKNGNIKIIFNFDEKERQPSNYVISFIKHTYPTSNDYKQGVEVKFFQAERKNPNLKVINKGFKSDVDNFITQNQIFEAILIDNQGFITEGSKSNFFMIKGNEIFTSPIEYVLPGITRIYAFEVSKALGIPMIEKCISFRDISLMDALFLSGTSPKILPVSKIDGHTFNPQNKHLQAIIKAYNCKIKDYLSERFK